VVRPDSPRVQFYFADPPPPPPPITPPNHSPHFLYVYSFQGGFFLRSSLVLFVQFTLTPKLWVLLGLPSTLFFGVAWVPVSLPYYRFFIAVFASRGCVLSLFEYLFIRPPSFLPAWIDSPVSWRFFFFGFLLPGIAFLHFFSYCFRFPATLQPRLPLLNCLLPSFSPFLNQNGLSLTRFGRAPVFLVGDPPIALFFRFCLLCYFFFIVDGLITGRPFPVSPVFLLSPCTF